MRLTLVERGTIDNPTDAGECVEPENPYSDVAARYPQRVPLGS